MALRVTLKARMERKKEEFLSEVKTWSGNTTAAQSEMTQGEKWKSRDEVRGEEEEDGV